MEVIWDEFGWVMMAEKEEIRREMEGRLSGAILGIWGSLESWVDFWSVWGCGNVWGWFLDVLMEWWKCGGWLEWIVWGLMVFGVVDFSIYRAKREEHHDEFQHHHSSFNTTHNSHFILSMVVWLESLSSHTSFAAAPPAFFTWVFFWLLENSWQLQTWAWCAIWWAHGLGLASSIDMFE